VGRGTRGPVTLSGGLLGCWNLRGDVNTRSRLPRKPEPEGTSTVKKLLVIVLLGLSAFAIWRKVKADRAELDLWTEATTADD
jgi:hypothetical protein